VNLPPFHLRMWRNRHYHDLSLDLIVVAPEDPKRRRGVVLDVSLEDVFAVRAN
jgi:hypothetical protein